MRYAGIFCLCVLFTAFAIEETCAQCAPEKDPTMKKYQDLVQNQINVQSCSQCGMLSMYLCSAKYCKTPEDKRKVNSLIIACKSNIRSMGPPVCCDDLLNSEPQWGSMVSSPGGPPSLGNDMPVAPANSIVLEGFGNPAGDLNSYGAGGFDAVPEVVEIANKIGNAANMVQQSFYAAENLANAEANLQNNLTLKKNYSSLEELEKDFMQKAGTLEQSVDQLTEAENNNLRTSLNMGLMNAGTEAQAIGQAAGSVLEAVNTLQAQKEKQRAMAQLEEQKQLLAEEMERKKLEMKIFMRKSLLQEFPEGGVPMTRHKVQAKTLYFFYYILDASDMNSKVSKIKVSNVFTVEQHADGTWPFKNDILADFKKQVITTTEPTLVGFYTDQGYAQSMHATFLRLALKAEMVPQAVAYTRKAKSKPAAAEDFWGEPVQPNDRSQPSPSPAIDEKFWGKPVSPK